MVKATPAVDRFWPKVEKTETCWLWTAALSPMGYGRFRGADGRTVQAHRFCYELIRGPIPDGLDLDHLCRVRNCVRPDHLEPVTRTENWRRGLGRFNLAGVTAAQRAKTHCPQGHPYDEANTRYKPRPGGGVNRVCRACARDQAYFAKHGRARVAPRGGGLLPRGGRVPFTR